jgi:hypothetical protein
MVMQVILGCVLAYLVGSIHLSYQFHPLTVIFAVLILFNSFRLSLQEEI